jgi:hypothetical protein
MEQKSQQFENGIISSMNCVNNKAFFFASTWTQNETTWDCNVFISTYSGM